MQDETQGLSDAIRNAHPPLFPDLAEVKRNLDIKAKANIAHTPRQQGHWIICTSCPNQHTIAWLGPFKKLTGVTPEGRYVIEPRKF